MRTAAVSWADEQIAIATWWSVWLSAASLVAAIVVGIFVARTLAANRDAADAARDQAALAQAALDLARERSLQDSANAAESLRFAREARDVEVAAARQALLRGELARIDNRMPTVTIDGWPSRIAVFMAEGELQASRPLRWVDERAVDPNASLWAEIENPLRIDLTEAQMTEPILWFEETVEIRIRNHSNEPARILISKLPGHTFYALDQRPLSPMYLAPLEIAGAVLKRRRSLSEIRDTADGSHRLKVSWEVGDIHGDALDLFQVEAATDFYECQGSVLQVSPVPDSSSARRMTALPIRRTYLREVGHSIAAPSEAGPDGVASQT